jgi:excisionase family DNA binding protein
VTSINARSGTIGTVGTVDPHTRRRPLARSLGPADPLAPPRSVRLLAKIEGGRDLMPAATSARSMDRPVVRQVEITPKWHTVAEVAAMLGYGLTKTKMLVITGELRSLKDGRSRRILPEWVDEYVARKAAEAEEMWS